MVGGVLASRVSRRLCHGHSTLFGVPPLTPLPPLLLPPSACLAAFIGSCAGADCGRLLWCVLGCPGWRASALYFCRRGGAGGPRCCFCLFESLAGGCCCLMIEGVRRWGSACTRPPCPMLRSLLPCTHLFRGVALRRPPHSLARFCARLGSLCCCVACTPPTLTQLRCIAVQ